MFSKLLLSKSISLKKARRFLPLLNSSMRSYSADPQNNYKTAKAPEVKAKEAKKEEPQVNEKAQDAKSQAQQVKSEEHKEDEYEQEFEHQEESTANFSFRRKVFFVLGKTIKYSIWTYLVMISYHFYLVRKRDKPEEATICFDYFLKHAYALNWHVNDITIMLTRPPVEKLLPDKPPMPPNMPYPKTLIIGLRGVTVVSDYYLGVGYEYKKRPGLNTFLQRLSRFYEVVVFGVEESSLVQELCEVLDPQTQIIVGRLGHESTLLKDGKYIRDLSYMNRPIRDIVCIDFDEEQYAFHKGNVIKVPQWNGEDDDRILIDLLPFLEHLADPRLDVRNELEKYGNVNPHEKFKDIQSARRDIILKQREKGFGGFVDKFGNSTFKPMPKIDSEFNLASKFDNKD